MAALDEVFGFREFRPDQQEIVSAILARRDVFAVMPTGGGKSLCYQLPACLLDGMCLVVSPLISLMKDQVDAAKANGIRAEFLNSSLAASDRARVTALLTGGELDLLYLAPERLAMDRFLPLLKAARLALIAIDEAHCISEWGHDFRKDYLELGKLVREFPDATLAAFTATATHRVQQDTVEKLGLRNPLMIRASFDRPNLFYQVIPKTDPETQIMEFVRTRAGESGIVYRTTRKDVEATAGYLQQHKIKAVPYHAGLTPDIRKLHQEMFNRDEVSVVVATIAFGMGIDKSNVRYVVHGDLPKNMEGYYQETGRSGRDGEPAHCLLLFGYGDKSRIDYFIRSIEDPEQRQIQTTKLAQMAAYGASGHCRRRQILGYFGEKYPGDNCGACDVCVPNAERVDSTREAQIVMSAIARTSELSDANLVIDIVTGNANPRVLELGHDKLKTFGAGKDIDALAWAGVIEDLLGRGCVTRDDGENSPLALTPKGKDVLFGRRKFTAIKSTGPADGASGEFDQAAEDEAYDEGLFEALRGLRKQVAREEGLPPFVIFSDRTLREMAREKPTGMPRMREIGGVGKQKLQAYGREFIERIKRYIRENPRPQAPPPVVIAPTTKFDTLQGTWELVQQGMSIGEIAKRRCKAASTIAEHIEQLILKGLDVDVSPYVGSRERKLLEKLFAQHGLQGLGPVVQASGGKIDYHQARLIRAMLQKASRP